ncbi:UPF0690 protein C1orf52 homolog [Amblyraja radiata]|uniref:UPF0690 protein C1orf52 homolog n=1 Tax=Amblyraja radiata TaxID=386614 RepID=UPI001402E983|nr:UPF0690 protein C1orf52 homolog [Amblyraja radiata]
MAEAEAQADPLSFFAAYGSSSSESESEPELEAAGTGTGAGAGTVEPGAGGGGAAAAPALPAPHELFGRVSRPSFLRDPRGGSIDWERRRLRPPHEPPKEFRAWKGSAVPPPESYDTEESKVPSGVDMAVKWSSMYQDHGDDAPHRDTGALPGTADNPDSDEENKEEPSSKKLRTESFQQKEKRKRNEGQANREKSFVEEEKRILRQEFCPKD